MHGHERPQGQNLLGNGGERELPEWGSFVTPRRGGFGVWGVCGGGGVKPLQHAYAQVHTDTTIHTHTHTYTHTRTHTHKRTNTYTYDHIYTYKHTYLQLAQEHGGTRALDPAAGRGGHAEDVGDLFGLFVYGNVVCKGCVLCV